MTSPLTMGQLTQLQQQLIQEKKDLEDQLKGNDHFGLEHSIRENPGELSNYDNHPADVATEVYERGKDIALNENAEYHLLQAEEALILMKEGKYGLCAVCHEAIPYERLEAIPTTKYCIDHVPNPGQHTYDQRPVEEDFLMPPFGRTSLDEQGDQNQFDGEDAWQIVESWGNSDSPAMAGDREIHDYNDMFIESDEQEGFVEPIESFLATDIYGRQLSVVRNKAYRRYIEDGEGDPILELDPDKDRTEDGYY
jgi:YteA family regulatory protein